MEPSGRPPTPAARRPAAPAPGDGAALLVVCALGVERFALRAAARAAPGVRLLRAGMGPDASGAAVARALATAPGPAPAVLVTGFCAGLAPGLRPGDVVVDDRSDAAGPLAEAVRRALTGRSGRSAVTVRTGRIAGSGHVVRGAERAALAASGALAVDMESEAVRRAALTAGSRPLAAVRVVVDTPEHELLRPGTLPHGVRAYRVLGSLMPAFRDWHRSS